MPTSKLRELYTVLVQDVRTMFQVCRLVHADLSEYNILYFAGRLAIIDVSQVRPWRACHPARRTAHYCLASRAVGGPRPPALLRLFKGGPHARQRLLQPQRSVACACTASHARPEPAARRHTGVATATVRELFDFVTDPTIGAHNIEACLDRLIALADERAAGGAECVLATRRRWLCAESACVSAGPPPTMRLRTLCSRAASFLGGLTK